MVALIIEDEKELNTLREKVEINDEDVKMPGLYYEHMGEWYSKYLYDAGMLNEFGYVLARPLSVKDLQSIMM